MNVVNAGAKFQIFGEDLKTFRSLPVGSYEVCFNKMSGFYLISHNDLVVNEDKIYGNHKQKVDKIMRAFHDVNRNLGVILSGQKGIGKSLFARILAGEAVKENIPLIIVSEYIPGISSFISSIEQEVIVLFDEFEKTFGVTEQGDPQEEMLSLFDGIDNGKKLFVITCNEVNKLNNYLLNRPGRFHYHFTLTNPTPQEVREYMTDKLLPQYQTKIDQVVSFAMCADVTYDYLRAIAFELNHGYSFEETLMDLNISKEKRLYFTLTVEFEDGTFVENPRECIDLYSSKTTRVWFYGENFGIDFTPTDIKVNTVKNTMTLDASKVKVIFDEDDFEDMPKEKVEFYKSRKIKNVRITKRQDDYLNRYIV